MEYYSAIEYHLAIEKEKRIFFNLHRVIPATYTSLSTISMSISAPPLFHCRIEREGLGTREEENTKEEKVI